MGLLMMSCPSNALAQQRTLGIDVSSYQGSGVNWTSVKSSGRVFAWAKATEGVSINDADFTINESNGKAAGVYMGAYHFAHPELNTPAAEAAHFWSIAGSYILADGKTFMPMLDMEVFSGIVGASTYSQWANAWCTEIVQNAANAGVAIRPVIYVSACNACYFDSSVAQWFSDIANYGTADGYNDPTNGTPWSSCTSCEVWGANVWHVWQYASAPPAGSVPGVTGNCDVDVFNGALSGLTNSMLATASTNSSIYYWDPQGTTGSNPYTGSMTETWENSKWSYSSVGLGSPVNWVDGKAACFGVHTGIGTPAYTVTMNSGHVVAGFFDGALAPNACDVTIQGAGIINLASGPQALDAHNASDGSLAYLRINCVIAGDGQLFPEGNGQSFLHGTNTFTGGTQLGYPGIPFSGTVNFNNGSAFGAGTITLTNTGTGGALVLEGTSAVTVTNPVACTAPTTNNIVGNPAGLTFSGNWSLGGNLLAVGTGATVGNQTIISGVISGTAGFKVYNSGTLVLSGVNTYSGTTTINSPAALTIGGAGQLGSGAYAGSIVNNGTLNYNSTASQTLSGVISGTGPLKTSNAGTLVLTAANTYSGGTTVGNGSALLVKADSALGASTAGVTLNGGCLKNDNSAPTIGSSRTITLGAAGGYLDAGWAPSNPLTISAKITGSGALLVDMDGSPVVLANTGNNYTGNTIIGTNGPGYYPSGTQAWLKLGASGVIPNGSGNGDVIINQAYLGMLDLAGFNQTINGLSGDGVVNNSTGNGALSAGNNNRTTTFNGIIENTSGTLSLTKVGSGTLTLAGANTYSGATTINAGTLALASTGSISNTPAISIAAGATLDVSAIVSFALSSSTALSASGGAAAATINGGTTVSLGSSPITLAYDGVHPALTIAQGALALNGNAFTINGAAVPLGTYTIIQQTTGSVLSSGISSVSGTAIGAGKTASISVLSGNVNLIISEPAAFSNLTPSQSITTATTNVTLSGKVSGAGPVYPASGEMVTVTINGSAQTTTINDATGDFSINYNPSAIPASATQYPIVYSYPGNAALNPANDTSTTLAVQPAVILSQTNIFLSISNNGDTTFTLNLLGTPQAVYYLLTASNPAQPQVTWTPLVGSTNTAPTNGQWSFVVSNPPPAFYRSRAVNPAN
jgi:autotransporter-associated beta strand protein